MSELADRLAAPMSAGAVSLEPLTEDYREALRAACVADDAVWAIYPISLAGAAFDPNFETMLTTPNRLALVIRSDARVIGTTSYWVDAANAVVEIGGTYLHPDCRGTGLNAVFKRLMIDRAFGCGVHRIEFRVDSRNARSIAAVAKLGAVREGLLRRNRVTWTGYVRDTVVFGLLPEDWQCTAG